MRMWIIGNGKSLADVNLELLKDEPCMSCNRINMIYPYTSWRPTHYLKVDYTHGEDWKEQVMSHVEDGEKCLLWDAFRSGAEKWDGNYEYIKDGIGDYPNVTYIKRCKHTNMGTGAWHLPEICTGCNSILPMIQWAVLLGYSPLYLLGCDGIYKSGEQDHFVKDYCTEWDDTYDKRNTDKTREAHEIAKAGCPVMVYNCTEGSAISVWEKMSMEAVLN